MKAVGVGICPVCGLTAGARYSYREDGVFFEKECPVHGKFSELAAENRELFERFISHEPVCAAPKTSMTKAAEGELQCPRNCGLCKDHLMSACCVLIDITASCNQRCPWCFASSEEAAPDDPDISWIKSAYDDLIRLGEERKFNIQLSGGEPTMRDDLPQIVRMGRQKGFEYIQLNTNGKRIADEKGYAHILKKAGVSAVFMQFDGMSDDVYMKMRGEKLLETKLRAIDECADARLPVTLVPTVLGGVNDDHIGALIRYMVSRPEIIKGVHFQPAAFFGRYPEQSEKREGRITMFEVMEKIETQTDALIHVSDLAPITTGHPLCCFCGSFLKEKDGSVSPLLSEAQTGSGISCCDDPLDIIRKDRDFVLNRWTAAAPDAAPCSADEVDAGALSLDEAVSYMEANSFTISGMAFMDESNLDGERLRRCRVQQYTRDGRLIPFCAYNTYYRKAASPMK